MSKLGQRASLSIFLHLSSPPSLSLLLFLPPSLPACLSLPFSHLLSLPFPSPHISVDLRELRPDLYQWLLPSQLLISKNKLPFLTQKSLSFEQNRRGCRVSNSPGSNYKGPIASCTDITSDLFKPFPLMITFSIRDKDICSLWAREQPDYSFIRKWCHSLLQSNWLTGFGVQKCKSLTVCVALLLSQ